MEYAGEMYYDIKGRQGDMVAIVDTSGNAVVEYGYNAWGRRIRLDTGGDGCDGAAVLYCLRSREMTAEG